MNKSYIAILQEFNQYLHTLGFANLSCKNFTDFAKMLLQYAENNNINKIRHLESKTIWDFYTHIQNIRSKRTKKLFSSSYLNHIFLATDKFLEFLHHIGLKNAAYPTHYKVERIRAKELQVLTIDEIKLLYSNIENVYLNCRIMDYNTIILHQQSVLLILNLCYACGLRRTEALNLKINDIDFDKRIIHLRQGKNNKDRIVPMNEKVTNDIQMYVYQYRKSITPKTERQNFLYPFGKITIANALKSLIKTTNNEIIICKKPTLHTLRHSIATHLLQNGMQIEEIAKFLGHSSIESTKLYTHIINEVQQ